MHQDSASRVETQRSTPRSPSSRFGLRGLLLPPLHLVHRLLPRLREKEGREDAAERADCRVDPEGPVQAHRGVQVHERLHPEKGEGVTGGGVQLEKNYLRMKVCFKQQFMLLCTMKSARWSWKLELFTFKVKSLAEIKNINKSWIQWKLLMESIVNL